MGGLGTMLAVAATVSCGVATSALAGWSGWYSAGGVIQGEPSIVAYGGGSSPEVAVVVRGGDDAMWWTRGRDGINFAGWESLGGVITSSPSCVSRAERILDCYARTPTFSVAQRAYVGGSWTPWVEHGGLIDSAPAAAGKFPGSTMIHAIGAGPRLYQIGWSADAGWDEWRDTTLAMPFDASLECDQSPVGIGREFHVVCLIRGGDNQIMGYERGSQGQALAPVALDWFGPLPEAPLSNYRPDLVLTGLDSGHVFIVALDSALWTASWTSGVGFGPWENLGGIFTSGPSCSSPKESASLDYTIICAGRGTDGAVWLNRLLK